MSARSSFVMLVTTTIVLLWCAMQERFRVFVPLLLDGAGTTLRIAALGSLLAFVCGVGSALARLYGPRPVRWLARIYIELFRGTSLMVQLFWLFFVLPEFGLRLAPFTVAVLALALNMGAYGAEVVRAAVEAVPRGQWEASTALNMTRTQGLRRIVLPQALVLMVPPWGNLFIELLKATALVSLITIPDLAFRAAEMNALTMKTTEIFLLVLLAYLAMALAITVLMRSLEHVTARGLARGRTR